METRNEFSTQMTPRVNKGLININFFGGPGTGKTTTAVGVFREMKKLGVSVEYCHEYAKDLVYSKDKYKLRDQLMILSQQSHPWFVLDGQVDYTVNDGPFLLGLVYLEENPHIPEKEFKDFILKVWNSYETINIFLERDLESHGYQTYGRTQDLQASLDKDMEIKKVLDDNLIPYIKMKMGEFSSEDVLRKILKKVSKQYGEK